MRNLLLLVIIVCKPCKAFAKTFLSGFKIFCEALQQPDLMHDETLKTFTIMYTYTKVFDATSALVVQFLKK